MTLLGASLAAHAQTAAPAPEAEARQVVERFFEAFNRHDPEAMLTFVHPDVQWLSVEGDRISVEAAGQAAVREAMQGYFSSFPSVRSSAERMMAAGPYVTVWERARWQGENGERAQASLAVYEVRESKIRRVWYYPSVR
jgi:uncharacterized protein (TIGR02246 family)